MIVAAGLIGISQARLPRPIRVYRDRVSVEISPIAADETRAGWLGSPYDAPLMRRRLSWTDQGAAL